MENNDEFVAAIDLGTSKIVAIVGRKNKSGKSEIIAFNRVEYRGIERGLIYNIEETAKLVMAAVSEVEKASGLKVTEVFVGISRRQLTGSRCRGFLNRDSDDLKIDKSDITTLLNDMHKIHLEQGDEILEIIAQYWIVDDGNPVINPLDLEGKRLEGSFYIIVGQKAVSENVKKCMNLAGLSVKGILTMPLAVADAVLSGEEKERGVVLIDIGEISTDLAIFRDGILRHLASIPLGGSKITDEIRKYYSIGFNEAEKIKIENGYSLDYSRNAFLNVPNTRSSASKDISIRHLNLLIRSSTDEILIRVLLEIENSCFKDKLSSGMVITGGGSLLKNIIHLAESKTGMNVRLGYPNESSSNYHNQNLHDPTFSTAVGLIINGSEY